jgi:hypothetical protein
MNSVEGSIPNEENKEYQDFSINGSQKVSSNVSVKSLRSKKKVSKNSKSQCPRRNTKVGQIPKDNITLESIRSKKAKDQYQNRSNKKNSIVRFERGSSIEVSKPTYSYLSPDNFEAHKR